jgi:hypothetical protein
LGEGVVWAGALDFVGQIIGCLFLPQHGENEAD